MSREGNEDQEVKHITSSELRPLLQAFNEGLGEYINDDQRYKLGRVLTIIDASIADPEQRKAIKDLVNNEWWTRGDRSISNRMASPHTDLRAICRTLGFQLYVPSANDVPASTDNSEDIAINHYQNIAKSNQ